MDYGLRSVVAFLVLVTVASAADRPRITMYSRPGCSPCVIANRDLSLASVDYSLIKGTGDPYRDGMPREIAESTMRDGYPVILWEWPDGSRYFVHGWRGMDRLDVLMEKTRPKKAKRKRKASRPSMVSLFPLLQVG